MTSFTLGGGFAAPCQGFGAGDGVWDWDAPSKGALLPDAANVLFPGNAHAQAAAMEYEPVSATKRFQAAHDLIAPYVVGPEGEIEGYTFLSSDAAFEGSVTDLVAHVNGRQAAVADYLAQ